jgi:signal recognition particle subunit SEC65
MLATSRLERFDPQHYSTPGPVLKLAVFLKTFMAQTDGAKNVSGSWMLTYPIYFSEESSWTDGRRVSRRLAVSAPTAAEIFRVCQERLQYTAVLESDKRHPRDFFVPGRVKVQLPEQVSGAPCSTPSTRRKLVLRAIATALLQERQAQSVAAAGQRGSKASKPNASGAVSGRSVTNARSAGATGGRRKQKR